MTARLDDTIVRRAVYVSELELALGGAWPGDLGADLAVWESQHASENGEAFSARLAALGVTRRRLRVGQSAARPRGSFGLVEAGVRQATQVAGQPAATDEGGDGNLPFAPLWLPFVRVAREALPFGIPAGFAPAGWSAWQRKLLQDLCTHASLAVYERFDAARRTGVAFDAFVEATMADGYRNLFGTYPALVRVINALLQSWLTNTQLLARRLEKDQAEVQDLLGMADAGSYQVVSVEAGLSERHAGGQQAALLTFADGRRVFYKPKDTSLERLVPTINEWLAAEGADWRFRFARCVGNAEYGWSEEIPHLECASRAEVQAYFQKAGGLLCLAYLLNATDLQFENVIASGPEPVLIDLETFFHPELRPLGSIGSPAAAGSVPTRSVLDTGLVTLWEGSKSHPSADWSGLGGSASQTHTVKRLHWEAVNTSAMRPVYRPIQFPAVKNEVRWRGVPQVPGEHADDIAEGFTRLFAFVLARRDSFERFLGGFAGARARLIFRPSQVYALMLKRSLLPENLSSGLRRNVSLDQLYRPPLRGGYLSPALRNVLDLEIDAMLGLDIPRWYVPLTSGRDGAQSPFAPFLWEDPLETVRQRVGQADPMDASVHREVIVEAFTRKPVLWPSSADGVDHLALAERIGELLLSRARTSEAGPVWETASAVALRSEPAGGDRHLGLYTGAFGTLLALAALDHAKGTQRARPWLDALSAALVRHSPSPPDALGIGHGLGARIYGCLLLEHWTAEGRWRDLAVQLAGNLTADAVQRCPEPDLLSGIAGLLVALTRLGEVTGSDEVLRLAETCVTTLEGRFNAGQGWVRPNGESPLGFAHGAAGIAFATAIFYRLTGDARSGVLAERAVRFDRAFYSESARNWPVLAGAQTGFMSAWCSGSPGLLLSRLAVQEVWPGGGLTTEIAAITERFPAAASRDFWCCGALGLAEILAQAGVRLGEAALSRRGRELAEEVISRGSRLCYFRFGETLADNYCLHPSLFRGVAGVLYTALRLARPGVFPCLLSFELPD